MNVIVFGWRPWWTVDIVDVVDVVDLDWVDTVESASPILLARGEASVLT